MRYIRFAVTGSYSDFGSRVEKRLIEAGVESELCGESIVVDIADDELFELLDIRQIVGDRLQRGNALGREASLNSIIE